MCTLLGVLRPLGEDQTMSILTRVVKIHTMSVVLSNESFVKLYWGAVTGPGNPLQDRPNAPRYELVMPQLFRASALAGGHTQ
jgi:hypothetical protein